MKRVTSLLLLVSALCLLVPSALRAQDLLSPYPSNQLGLPPELHNVGFLPVLNNQIPLNLVFHDENAKNVQLQDFFQHGKPVILALVYYRCPMLCDQELDGLVGSLKMLTLNPGEDFQVVVVSFSPTETPPMAADKKQEMLAHFRNGNGEGWHFLTGSQDSIAALTSAAGFRYAWDKESNTWVHASGILLLTPEGKISRYFYGIEYSPRDVRLGLVEASHGKAGTPVDQVLLYCYHYDPRTGKYGAAVSRILQLGGALTLLGIAAVIYLCVRRTRHLHNLRATGVH